MRFAALALAAAVTLGIAAPPAAVGQTCLRGHPRPACSGFLVLEFGEGQDKQVMSIVTRTKAYDEIKLLSDAEGIPRAVCARKGAAATG